MTDPIKYYTFDANNDEVQGPFYSDIVAGAHHYPADSLTTEPLPPQADKAVVAIRDPDGKPIGYQYLDDHRGKKVWHKQNVLGYGVVMDIGPLEDAYTHDEPPSEYHTWNGSAWQLDAQAKYDHDLELAQHLRLSANNLEITPLRNEVMDLRYQGKDTEADQKHGELIQKMADIETRFPLPTPPTP